MTQEHPDDFDSPWKEALEQALPGFLAPFFPQTHAAIDGFRVLDWMLRLPEDLELEFREELMAFEEEKHMPYVTSVERIGIQKGLQLGLEQGLEQGLERGLEQGLRRGWQEGRREGEAEMLLRQIALKFGPPSEDVRARIEAADADTLLDWSARILTAERVDDIFR